MQNTLEHPKSNYAGYSIEVTLSRYGLFTGVEQAASNQELNESKTRDLFAAATQSGLEAIYPGADISVSYHYDETTTTCVNVEGDDDEKVGQLGKDVLETLETVELFDFSDESVWHYDAIPAPIPVTGAQIAALGLDVQSWFDEDATYSLTRSVALDEVDAVDEDGDSVFCAGVAGCSALDALWEELSK